MRRFSTWREFLALFFLLSFVILQINGSSIDSSLRSVKKVTKQLSPNSLRGVKRACPNNCNGHGTCVSNACSCNSGWAGSDCSIALTPLVNATTIAGSVALRAWQMYSISVASGTRLVVAVNQTTIGGDADMYIRFNDFPTRNSYDYRDGSSSSKFNLTIDVGTRSGIWYVGIFGYTACSYNIRGTVYGDSCPNGCSGHGSCSNSICSCNAGYTGVDCSIPYTELIPDVTYAGRLATGAWNYYHYSLETGNTLSFVLNQTSTGDCDIYLQFNKVPLSNDYLYVNVTSKNVSTLNVPDAAQGDWYVGIFGFRACSYILLMKPTTIVCPNDCSQRGTCFQGSCTCQNSFSGDYCQTYDPEVALATSYTGFVTLNAWNYYHYTSNTLDNLVITVDQEEANSDCDLFVKAGDIPTRSNYDYYDASFNEIYSLTIPSPGQNTWYIGVFGWRNCSYMIRFDLSSSCPNNCNNHGSCNSDGLCECEPGYSGNDCSQAAFALGNNAPLSDDVGYNEWKYYFFTLLDSESLYIQVREVNTTGLVGVYLGKDVPDLRNYEYASASPQDQIHRVSVHFNAGQTFTYQIGVNGGPFILPNQRVAYQIIAYSPDF